MPRLRPTALAAALLGLGVLAPRAAFALDWSEVNARAKGSVALLTVYDARGEKDALGTGFVVGKGRVATNHHVIEGASRVTATFDDGVEVPVAGLLADDEKVDLALLAVTTDRAPLPLGDATTAHPGDEVAVIGSPLGLAGTLSTGIVSALRDAGMDDKDERVASWGLQITAPISHGSSGSPIMNRSGEVIAVAVGMRLGGEGLNFGIPVAFARGMLARLPDDAAAAPFTRSLDVERKRNLWISAAFAAFGVVAYLVWSRRGRRED